MPDTDRLINKDQGDSIISAIQGITARLQEMYTVDDALSSTSENPVQNKVVKGALDGKVDTVSGKGLSTNDYTTAEKEKLAGIEAGAQVNTVVPEDIESTQTATGNPITLTDAAPINAESLVVELEPKQEGSGDPSPTNVRPITGYTECNVDECGKNLFDKDTEQILNGYLDSSGNYHASNSGEKSTISKKLQAGTYTISKRLTTRFRVSAFETNQIENFGTPLAHTETYVDTHLTITLPTSGYIVIFFWNNTGETGTTQEVIDTIQIEEGSTATSFEPYHSSNATIQFGQTVYGGKVDFLTGVLTVDRGYVDLGTIYWSKGSDNLANYMWAKMDELKKSGFSICSSYVTSTSAYTLMNDKEITTNNTGVSDSSYIVLKNTDYASYTDVEVKAAMNGVQLVYELATSITMQLTPQELKLLQDTNNLTTNGTTINLGYQPDNVIGEVKGEIQKITEMPYLRILDNDVDTEVKNYRLYYRLISSSYTLVNLAEMLQHRFLFVEVIQNPSGTANHTLLHSALIDPRTIDGFEYQMKAGTGDTVIVESNIAENKFDLSVRYTGTHTSGDPTDYYVTIRMVD